MLSPTFKYLVLALGLSATSVSFAAGGLTINAGEGAVNPLTDLSVAGATQRSVSNQYTMRFRASCFGTNLRGVGNPLSPSATITMYGKVVLDDKKAQDFTITFSAAAALFNNAKIQSSLASTGLPANSNSAFNGNLVVAKIPSTATSTINPVTAEIKKAQQQFKMSDIHFYQSIPGGGGGQYYGRSGWLSSSAVRINPSSDGKTLDIETSFPGQEGFCGGYHSPLMVFLDDKIPEFKNIVGFNMGHGLKTYWPEKNHAGYFVALPNKGKVLSNNELFGESSEYPNGFAKLAVHDLNKDGVIDIKDPVYKKLVLWKDSKGNGVYTPKDSIPLASLVKSINLKFEPKIMQVGEFAEFREKSTLVLQKQTKDSQKAYIVDVWLKPALGIEDNLNLPKLSSK